MATPSVPYDSPAEGRSRRNILRGISFNDREIRVTWRLLLYAALFAAISEGLHYVFPPLGKPLPSIIAVLLLLSFPLLPALVMSRIEKRGVAQYGLPLRGAFGKLFWQGWLLGFIEVTVLVGAMAMFHSLSFGTVALDLKVVATRGLELACLVIGKALFLQFLLRGYAQYTLAGGIGFWSAAQVLSALYVIGSGLVREPSGTSLLGLPVLFLVGLLWSLTLSRTGSLWFAIGLQASFEFAAAFLYSVPSLGFAPPTCEHLFNVTQRGSAWLTGGAMGIEGSPLRFLTLGILILLVNKFYPVRPAAGPRTDCKTSSSQSIDS